MEMWDKLLERESAAAAVRHLWQEHGITYRPIVMVVFGMACAPDTTYWEVLEIWAQYVAECDGFPAWPASRWHSEICYKLLKAGYAGPSAEAWMKDRAREVREIANGIYA